MQPYTHYATPRYALEQLPNLVVACQEELARELGWSTYYYKIFASSKFFTQQPISYRFSLRTATTHNNCLPTPSSSGASLYETSSNATPFTPEQVIPAELVQKLSKCIQEVLERPLTSYACAASPELLSNQHSQLFTPINVNALPIQQFLHANNYSWSQVSNYFHCHSPELNLWQALTLTPTQTVAWDELDSALPSWFNALPAHFKDKLRSSPRLPQFTLRNLTEVYSQLRAQEWIFWTGDREPMARTQLQQGNFTLPASHQVEEIKWSQYSLEQQLSSNLLAQSLLNPAFEYNLLESNSSMALHRDFDYLAQEVRTFSEFNPHIAKGSYKNPRYLQLLPRHAQLLLDPKFPSSLATLIQDWLILDLTLEEHQLTWQEWLAQVRTLHDNSAAQHKFLNSWFASLRKTYLHHPELHELTREPRLYTPYCYLCSRAELQAYAQGKLDYADIQLAIGVPNQDEPQDFAQEITQLVSSHELLRYEALLVLLNQQLRTICQTQYLLAHRQVQLLGQLHYKHNETTNFAFHSDFLQICDSDTLHDKGWVTTLGNLSKLTLTHDLAVSYINYTSCESPVDFLSNPYLTWHQYINHQYRPQVASQNYLAQIQQQLEQLDPHDYQLDYQAISTKAQDYLPLNYELHPFTRELAHLNLESAHNLGISLVSYIDNYTYPQTRIGRFTPEELPRLLKLLTTQAHHTGVRTTFTHLYRLTAIDSYSNTQEQYIPAKNATVEHPREVCSLSTTSHAIARTAAQVWNQQFTQTVAKLWSEPPKSCNSDFSSTDTQVCTSMQGYLLAPSICCMLRNARADAQFLTYNAIQEIDYQHSNALALCNHFELFDLHDAQRVHPRAYEQCNAYTWAIRNIQLQQLTRSAELEPRSYGELHLEGECFKLNLKVVHQAELLTPLAHRHTKAEQHVEPYLVHFHNQLSQRQAQVNLQLLERQAIHLQTNTRHWAHVPAPLNQRLVDLERTSHAELQAWRTRLALQPHARNRLSNLYQVLTHLELRKLFREVLQSPHVAENAWVTIIHGHYQVQENLLRNLQTWQQHAGVGLLILDTPLNTTVMHCYFGARVASHTSYHSLDTHNVLNLSNYQRQVRDLQPYYTSQTHPYLGQGLGISLTSNWSIGCNRVMHERQLRTDLIPSYCELRDLHLTQQQTTCQSIYLTTQAWLLSLILAQFKVTQRATLQDSALNYSQHHFQYCKQLLGDELRKLAHWVQSFNREVASECITWLTHLQTQLTSTEPLDKQWQQLQDNLSQYLNSSAALHPKSVQLIQSDLGNLEHFLRCEIEQLTQVAPDAATAQLASFNFQVVDTITNLEALLALQTPLKDELATRITSYLHQQLQNLQCQNPAYQHVELSSYINWLQQFTRVYASTSTAPTANLNMAQLIAICMRVWLHLIQPRCSSNVQHGVALETNLEQGAGTWGMQTLGFRWRVTSAVALQYQQVINQLTFSTCNTSTTTPSLRRGLPSHYRPTLSTQLKELFHARQSTSLKLTTLRAPVQQAFSEMYHELYQHTTVPVHLVANYLCALTQIQASSHFSYLPPYLQPLQVAFSSAPITVRIELLEPDDARRELWLKGRNPRYRDYKYSLCELLNLSPLSVWRNQLLQGYAPAYPQSQKTVTDDCKNHINKAPTTSAATLMWHEFACLVDYLALNLNPNAHLGHTGLSTQLSIDQVIRIMRKHRVIDMQIDIDNDYLALPVQFYTQRINYPTIAHRSTMPNLENFAIRKDLIRQLQPVWEREDFRTQDLVQGLVKLEAQVTGHNNEQGITRGNYHLLLTRCELLCPVVAPLGNTDLGVAHHWNNPYAIGRTTPRQTSLEIRYLNLESDTHKAAHLEASFARLQAEFARHGIQARLVRQPAVHGKYLSSSEYHARFDEDGFKRKYYRVPAFGEVGCTLSYIEHMHAIAANEQIAPHEYVFMIEDDLVFSPSFVEHTIQLLLHLEMMVDNPYQHPPRWINGFHYRYTSLQPLDPRDERQFAHTNTHWLHSAYQITSMNLLRPAHFSTNGSVCTLIRKDLAQTISNNLRQHHLRPYWLADDFCEFPGMLTSDYALINPRLTILHEEFNNASNINDERQRKRAYAIYLGQRLPIY